jgi:phage shock protein C
MTTQPVEPSTPQRRLVRRRQERMVGGVCAGVAAHLGVDVTLVRVLTVLGTVFGFGSILVVYLVLWAVLPLE